MRQEKGSEQFSGYKTCAACERIVYRKIALTPFSLGASRMKRIVQIVSDMPGYDPDALHVEKAREAMRVHHADFPE